MEASAGCNLILEKQKPGCRRSQRGRNHGRIASGRHKQGQGSVVAVHGRAIAGQAMRALLSSSMCPALARPAVRQQHIAAAAAMFL